MGYTPLATRIDGTTDCSPRTQPANMLIFHHGATTSLEAIVSLMQPGGRQVSAHAAVKNTEIVGTVVEEMRAWSLSDAYWDSRAFTVECANESTAGWTISAASHESLAQLAANWAAHYGFKINRSGDPKTWTLLGHREVYTIWGGSYATACPGGMNLDWIAKRANEILNTTVGKDSIMASELLKGPDKDSAGAAILAVCSPGVVTRYALSYEAALEAQHGPATELSRATMDARQEAYLAAGPASTVAAIEALTAAVVAGNGNGGGDGFGSADRARLATTAQKADIVPPPPPPVYFPQTPPS